MWSNISSPPKSFKVKQEQTLCEPDEQQQQLAGVNTSATVSVRETGSPLMRYKHAVCSAPNGYIYIHGGRFGNLPLDDDVWRFDPHQNSWLQLETHGERPPSLQGHTLVEHDERLYMFGGQVSAANCDGSFWQLDLLSGEWRSLARTSSKLGAHLGPTNRRGHSAVIYTDSMYVFGGFEDFRGSSAQLWEFDLHEGRWELRNLSSTSACHPEPRHSHSAIVHANSMYVYGGLSNLKPLGDLWRWSWNDKRWFKERTRGRSPGQLHGHTAIQAFGSMFVFGGERNGRPTRGLWRLNLANLTWQKVRPKGPRPSPTTWHGAIANPLSILDEANYIIEGADPELLRGGSLCGATSVAYTSNNKDNCNDLVGRESQMQHRPEGTTAAIATAGLSHSKSSSAAPKTGIKNSAGGSTKRKSRLGFLRRSSRHERNSRSNYEIKQQQVSNSTSAVANLGSAASSIGHSTPGTNEDEPLAIKTERSIFSQQQAEPNAKILDSLDTDIKEMFQRALSPDNDDEPMESADLVEGESLMTSRSQYQTAAGPTDSATCELSLRSQRTSYAYATPPSELHTLREPAQGPAHTSHLNHQLALLASRTPINSGYDRRNNRPKSEIVQSLIERADARIKHLYTPYFNQPASNEVARGQERARGSHFSPGVQADQQNSKQQNYHHRNGHSFVDKSKRHTIHQTMTYYNLYFAEDKSSSSPPSDGSGVAQAQEGGEADKQRQRFAKSAGDDDEFGNQHTSQQRQMVRDDLSSSTIRGSAVGSSSGVLVGVRGDSQVDQQSQLSLEANSSDSRTICGELVNQTAGEQFNSSSSSSSGADAPAASANAVTGQSSSIQNALTARRDVGESCDNTSLSFSVIAEFEEDDMLQYSSPTDPVIMRDFSLATDHHHRQKHQARAASYHDYDRDSDDEAIDDSDELGAEYRVSQQGTSGPVGNQLEHSSSHMILDDSQQQQRQQHHGGQRTCELLPQKSASSGYDSIYGFEHSARSRTESGRSVGIQLHHSPGGAEGNTISAPMDSHESCSVRTDSSLGFNETNTTNTTETSPEQSVHKKMRGRQLLEAQISSTNAQANGKVAGLKLTASSTTADSMAVASDADFELSLATKSLPSSPPGPQPNQISMSSASAAINSASQDLQQQRRLPLVSRARLLGKQKSKNRYWQLCMFVIGGKQGGVHGINEPITIWRLYI